MNYNEQLERISQQLETGVKEVFTSEQYLKYLKTMAKFHTYSASNTLLIFMQRPDATLVAGYNAWKSKFHRCVKKGEKAIRIIAPIRRKKMYPIIMDGTTIEDEEPLTVGFRIVNVFDLSQTYGDDIPFYMSDVLPGMVNDYEHFIDALLLLSPVPVSFETIESHAKGYYRIQENDIVIEKSLSQVQTIKTLIHEMAHAHLHHDALEDSEQSRYVREVQAESIAYAVCSYYGIDTSEYSFPYIAGWSSSQSLEELKDSLDIIKSTSDYFITTMNRVRTPINHPTLNQEETTLYVDL